MGLRIAMLPTTAMFAFATMAVGIAACRKDKPAPDEGAIVAQATAAITPFKAAFRSELVAALAKGPTDAIDVCAVRAPALAQEHSRGGVRVGRASQKVRNPANVPPPWLVPVLAELGRTPSGTSEHRVVPLEGGRYGYAEAIWVQPMCLTCHGESVAPEVDAKLRARYPADAARGYKAGDFRGVLYAEVTPGAT
jgi:hypothetical protein